MKGPAGYRNLARGEDQLVLHLAPIVRRFAFCGRIAWQAFLPGQRVAFAVGSALSEEGATAKAWKAFDAYMEGRRRWMGRDHLFTDNRFQLPPEP
jgi:hypothetical protein